MGKPFVVETGNHIKLVDAWTMLFYLTAGVICGTITSLVTPRPAKEKLDAFFSCVATA